MSDPGNPSTPVSSAHTGTKRWASPELIRASLDNLRPQPNKASDCYALGMVVLEVLSGEVPYAGDSTLFAMEKALKGQHPEQPKETWFTDDLWGMLEQCWAICSEDRPSVEVVLEFFTQVLGDWKPLSPLVDGGTRVDSVALSSAHTQTT